MSTPGGVGLNAGTTLAITGGETSLVAERPYAYGEDFEHSGGTLAVNGEVVTEAA